MNAISASTQIRSTSSLGSPPDVSTPPLGSSNQSADQDTALRSDGSVLNRLPERETQVPDANEPLHFKSLEIEHKPWRRQPSYVGEKSSLKTKVNWLGEKLKGIDGFDELSAMFARILPGAGEHAANAGLCVALLPFVAMGTKGAHGEAREAVEAVCGVLEQMLAAQGHAIRKAEAEIESCQPDDPRRGDLENRLALMRKAHEIVRVEVDRAKERAEQPGILKSLRKMSPRAVKHSMDHRLHKPGGAKASKEFITHLETLAARDPSLNPLLGKLRRLESQRQAGNYEQWSAELAAFAMDGMTAGMAASGVASVAQLADNAGAIGAAFEIVPTAIFIPAQALMTLAKGMEIYPERLARARIGDDREAIHAKFGRASLRSGNESPSQSDTEREASAAALQRSTDEVLDKLVRLSKLKTGAAAMIGVGELSMIVGAGLGLSGAGAVASPVAAGIGAGLTIAGAGTHSVVESKHDKLRGEGHSGLAQSLIDERRGLHLAAIADHRLGENAAQAKQNYIDGAKAVARHKLIAIIQAAIKQESKAHPNDFRGEAVWNHVTRMLTDGRGKAKESGHPVRNKVAALLHGTSLVASDVELMQALYKTDYGRDFFRGDAKTLLAGLDDRLAHSQTSKALFHDADLQREVAAELFKIVRSSPNGYGANDWPIFNDKAATMEFGPSQLRALIEGNPPSRELFESLMREKVVAQAKTDAKAIRMAALEVVADACIDAEKSFAAPD